MSDPTNHADQLRTADGMGGNLPPMEASAYPPGAQPLPPPGLHDINQALGLLNSMILCGERHSETSQQAVDRARIAMTGLLEQERQWKEATGQITIDPNAEAVPLRTKPKRGSGLHLYRSFLGKVMVISLPIAVRSDANVVRVIEKVTASPPPDGLEQVCGMDFIGGEVFLRIALVEGIDLRQLIADAHKALDLEPLQVPHPPAAPATQPDPENSVVWIVIKHYHRMTASMIAAHRAARMGFDVRVFSDRFEVRHVLPQTSADDRAPNIDHITKELERIFKGIEFAPADPGKAAEELGREDARAGRPRKSWTEVFEAVGSDDPGLTRRYGRGYDAGKGTVSIEVESSPEAPPPDESPVATEEPPAS